MDDIMLKSFLTKHRDDLMKYDYEKIYADCPDCAYLTNFLYKRANRNPLIHMKKIPQDMFRGVSLPELTIPRNITEGILYGFSCDKLMIEAPIRGYSDLVISNCRLGKVLLGDGFTRIKRSFIKYDNVINMLKLPDSIQKIDNEGIACSENNFIIVTNKRDERNRIIIPKNEIDYYKKHLRYLRAKQVEEPAEEEL